MSFRGEWHVRALIVKVQRHSMASNMRVQQSAWAQHLGLKQCLEFLVAHRAKKESEEGMKKAATGEAPQQAQQQRIRCGR